MCRELGASEALCLPYQGDSEIVPCMRITADAFSVRWACWNPASPPHSRSLRLSLPLHLELGWRTASPSPQPWDYRCMQLCLGFECGLWGLESSTSECLYSLNHHLLILVQFLLWRWRRCSTDLLSRVPWAVVGDEGGFPGNGAFSSNASNGKWSVGRECQQPIFSCPSLPFLRTL